MKFSKKIKFLEKNRHYYTEIGNIFIKSILKRKVHRNSNLHYNILKNLKHLSIKIKSNLILI